MDLFVFVKYAYELFPVLPNKPLMINKIRGWIMKAKQTDLLNWQQRYGTEKACTQALALQRWPEGFLCPRCGHDHGYRGCKSNCGATRGCSCDCFSQMIFGEETYCLTSSSLLGCALAVMSGCKAPRTM